MTRPILAAACAFALFAAAAPIAAAIAFDWGLCVLEAAA